MPTLNRFTRWWAGLLELMSCEAAYNHARHRRARLIDETVTAVGRGPVVAHGFEIVIAHHEPRLLIIPA